MKLYQYPKCSTCVKARKYLEATGVEFEAIDISETPPSPEELATMCRYYAGTIKKLFNTSGKQYRELNMKDRLPGMSQDEALALLSENGMLVKRPFLMGDEFGRVGFKHAEWDDLFK